MRMCHGQTNTVNLPYLGLCVTQIVVDGLTGPLKRAVEQTVGPLAQLGTFARENDLINILDTFITKGRQLD